MRGPEVGEAAPRWFQRLEGKVRRHRVAGPVVLVLSALMFAYGAFTAVTWANDTVRDLVDPHREEVAALESLRVGAPSTTIEKAFGPAQEVVQLCTQATECPGTPPEDLRMLIHHTDAATVRTVFVGDRLELYAVTLASDEVRLPIRWLGYEMGDLGKVTFADAMTAADGVSATDSDVFVGPRSSAFVEVLAHGAPAGNHGLFLAFDPAGLDDGQIRFDLESARAADQAITGGDETGGPSMQTLRDGSTPNTWGEFGDDGGYVGTLANDASEVRALLFAGGER